MRTVTTLLAAVLMLLLLPAHAVDAVDGFDMPGGDYSNFPAGSAFVCRNTCGGESRCQGWTWVKPGILGPTGHCWLKHTLPPLVKNDCCISGSRDDISARDLVRIKRIAQDRITRTSRRTRGRTANLRAPPNSCARLGHTFDLASKGRSAAAG